MAALASMSHGFVVILLVTIYLSCTKAGVHQFLKQFNKPAIKSIKSPDGDIIDCVRISQQPAFDHPLLKNHTIQMRPTFHPFGLDDENEVASKKKTSPVTQLWHQNGRCPEGTIPIRRTKKEDVLRAGSIERFGKKRSYALPRSNATLSGPLHVHSYAFVDGGKYYGTRVFMDVWNPYVQDKDEFSDTQLWIAANSPQNDVNTIEAGWHVYPHIYGDNKTRLFIYWTKDSYKQTGCYNLFCPGFVQVNKEMALGGSIDPVSSYGGGQHGIDLTVFKEPQTGHWWFQYGNKTIGYWPSSLFSHLSYATSVLWGGEAINLQLNGKHTSTQMGSGHFAEEGYGKASFCSNLKILDESLTQLDPHGIRTASASPNCYNLRDATDSSELQTHFYYGGPGRNPKCP